MSHIEDALLQAFVDGDVGEHLAVEIATHLDSCPLCSTRTASLEPLAAVFASVSDPEIPDLTAAVLAEVAEPANSMATEMILGGGLLVAAAGLFALVGEPGAGISYLTRVTSTFSSTAAAVQAGPVSPLAMASLTMALGAVCAVLLVQTTWPQFAMRRLS